MAGAQLARTETAQQNEKGNSSSNVALSFFRRQSLSHHHGSHQFGCYLGDAAYGALFAAQHLSHLPKIRSHPRPRVFIFDQRPEL
jgi:hypothetical protein